MTCAFLRELRDPQGKGLLGCMFFIVLFAVILYLGILLAPVYYANYNFESQVETEASRAGARFLEDDAIIKDVMDLAKKNDIRLKRDNIKIERFAGQIHIDVHYTVPVDFALFKKDLDFKIEASSFIGTL